MSPLFFEQNSSLCCSRGWLTEFHEPWWNREGSQRAPRVARGFWATAVSSWFSRGPRRTARGPRRDKRGMQVFQPPRFPRGPWWIARGPRRHKEGCSVFCLRDLLAARGEPCDGRVDSVVTGSGMVLCNASFYHYYYGIARDYIVIA